MKRLAAVFVLCNAVFLSPIQIYCGSVQNHILDSVSREYWIELVREAMTRTSSAPPLSKKKLFEKIFVTLGGSMATSMVASGGMALVGHLFMSRLGTPFVVNRAIKRVQEKNEKEKSAVKENIFEENTELNEFYNKISQDDFPFTALLLYGPTGLGKTSYAYYIANQTGALFYSFGEIARDVELNAVRKPSPNVILTYMLNMIQTRKRKDRSEKSIIFFDEIDDTLKNLNDFKSIIDTHKLKDNENYNNIIVIGTTNEIDNLKAAERDRFQVVHVSCTGNMLQKSFFGIFTTYGLDGLMKLVLKRIDTIRNKYENLLDQSINENLEKWEEEKSSVLGGLGSELKAKIKFQQGILGKFKQTFIEHNDLFYPCMSLRKLQDALTSATDKIKKLDSKDSENFEELKLNIIAEDIHRVLSSIIFKNKEIKELKNLLNRSKEQKSE